MLSTLVPNLSKGNYILRSRSCKRWNWVTTTDFKVNVVLSPFHLCSLVKDLCIIRVSRKLRSVTDSPLYLLCFKTPTPTTWSLFGSRGPSLIRGNNTPLPHLLLGEFVTVCEETRRTLWVGVSICLPPRSQTVLFCWVRTLSLVGPFHRVELVETRSGNSGDSE